MDPQSGIASLSFVQRTKTGIDLWPRLSDAEDRESGTEIGRARADELLLFMRRNQAPHALGFVIEAMIAAGRSGMLEVGFCSGISMAATMDYDPAVEREPIQDVGREPLLRCVGGTEMGGR